MNDVFTSEHTRLQGVPREPMTMTLMDGGSSRAMLLSVVGHCTDMRLLLLLLLLLQHKKQTLVRCPSVAVTCYY